MARTIARLNARKVATLAKPGRYADGGNLYLSVSSNGGRRWVFLYRAHGKPTEVGLGSARAVSLAHAREMAAEARALVTTGHDPREVRRTAADKTFGEAADDLIEAMRPSWRSAKHGAQWEMTLRDYAAPLRGLPVDAITTDNLLGVLKPLWTKRPETASRLRGRIERVLDAAKAKGWRSGDNPARWRGHLDQLLPPRRKLARGHHAAMPYSQVPQFLAALRVRSATAALALEFAILTAARSAEVLGAQWSEIDLENRVWTLPPTRMKAGREHRVPLSRRALAILKAMRDAGTGDFVFPGQKPGQPLSVMALEMVLRRMKVEGATVHGFRSAFRDWAAERTNVPNEVCEAALAHTVRDKTEAAYRRGDLFEKRRKLMDAWAAACASSESANVVPLRPAVA
jgi:integrase